MGDDVQLSILRSDGGLASSRAASDSPVNLLMSGPGRRRDRRHLVLHRAPAIVTC